MERASLTSRRRLCNLDREGCLAAIFQLPRLFCLSARPFSRSLSTGQPSANPSLPLAVTARLPVSPPCLSHAPASSPSSSPTVSVHLALVSILAIFSRLHATSPPTH